MDELAYELSIALQEKEQLQSPSTNEVEFTDDVDSGEGLTVK